MEITDVKIKKVASDGKLKAYVSLTFDDCFVVHNLKIIEGKGGIFVAMPNRKTKKGEFKDIAHPINSDCRSTIQTRILSEYEKVKDQDIETVEEEE
jgi:stage V sporulation protein G